MKWWAYVLIAVSIFAVGFVAGLRTRGAPSVVYIDRPDAGVVTATASTGPVSCDAGVVVRVVPGKPRVIYLPGDSGTVECPICPTLEVTATAGSSTSSNLARADAPLAPPTIVHQIEYRETRRVFGLGPAISKPYNEPGIGFGVTAQVQPFDWLEITGTFTTKEVIVSPTYRWK